MWMNLSLTRYMALLLGFIAQRESNPSYTNNVNEEFMYHLMIQCKSNSDKKENIFFLYISDGSHSLVWNLIEADFFRQPEHMQPTINKTFFFFFSNKKLGSISLGLCHNQTHKLS